jgi:hypothetical protein
MTYFTEVSLHLSRASRLLPDWFGYVATRSDTQVEGDKIRSERVYPDWQAVMSNDTGGCSSSLSKTRALVPNEPPATGYSRRKSPVIA